MDTSATHDTLQFYCPMLGHDESRVSVANIENRQNGEKKNGRHAFSVDSPPKVRLEDG